MHFEIKNSRLDIDVSYFNKVFPKFSVLLTKAI